MFPANIIRNKYVIIVSKRRFDVTITYSLRSLFAVLVHVMGSGPTGESHYLDQLRHSSQTHICATRPQSVNCSRESIWFIVRFLSLCPKACLSDNAGNILKLDWNIFLENISEKCDHCNRSSLNVRIIDFTFFCILGVIFEVKALKFDTDGPYTKLLDISDGFDRHFHTLILMGVRSKGLSAFNVALFLQRHWSNCIVPVMSMIAIAWWPYSVSEVTLKAMGNIGLYQTTARQSANRMLNSKT